MKKKFFLHKHHFSNREGLLLQLRDQAAEGWGEISPLPGFSKETIMQSQKECCHLLAHWLEGKELTESTLPSVSFGMSCALAELHNTLPEIGDYRTVLLLSGNSDSLLEILQSLSGEKVAKIKVGLKASRDGTIINDLLKTLLNLTLRIDANRSWTLSEAYSFARCIEPNLRHRIAFLEEPCITFHESILFAKMSGINIAWDESLYDLDFCLSPHSGVKAIVVKPTLVGSLARCQKLIYEAHQAGLMSVISSTFESSLGLTQLARIASWLTPGIMPGLGTLDKMQIQLLRPWPKNPLPLETGNALTVVWSQ